MLNTVTFLVRSTMQNDPRRIRIKNQGYPFQPQIGGHICLPCVGEIRVCPQVRIVDIEFPASNYFQGPQELTCYGELTYQDFNLYYEWLESLKEKAGLTHQWERWSLCKL